MYKILSVKARIWVLLVSIGGIYFILALAYPYARGKIFGEVSSWIAVGSWTVMLTTLLATLFSSEAVCSFLIRDSSLKLLGVPPFRGKYKGQLRSNYSRLDALRSAARSVDEPRLDADSPDFIDAIEPLNTEAELEVKASLCKVSIVLTSYPAKDGHLGIVSKSSVSGLECGEENTVVISYLYTAVNIGQPRGNDQLRHEGAASLTFALNGSANGLYWTARNWSKGMNTAGEMRFVKD